ncbi:MAG: 4-(cytidine 5'-diphospho)-2-C-methyl-D-erythritol kinase [Gemmatimonadetes bacterium]|nr:4-(cytidine 5'-diphospho)-2-C-methyl-D-erythritol kinase [Gemmatimonadota bacterium]
MTASATPETVTLRAHAKLNLFLRVLAREASGFHGLETAFSLVELSDELSVRRIARGVELTVEGVDTGPPNDNLAVRAAHLVLDATGNRFGVRMHLRKNIPVRAGLGGGSSDGAAALWAVNTLAGNAVPGHEILQFASRLGSDVPFFAARVPFALAWGHGERLFRLPPPPPAPVLLVVPDFGVSTAEAYGQLDAARAADPARGAVVLDPTALSGWGSIARLGGNDFESVLFAREPRLRALFERLAETRPLLLRLSGSGSAIAAVYRTPDDRNAAQDVLGQPDRVSFFATETMAEAPAA